MHIKGTKQCLACRHGTVPSWIKSSLKSFTKPCNEKDILSTLKFSPILFLSFSHKTELKSLLTRGPLSSTWGCSASKRFYLSFFPLKPYTVRILKSTPKKVRLAKIARPSVITSDSGLLKMSFLSSGWPSASSPQPQVRDTLERFSAPEHWGAVMFHSH